MHINDFYVVATKLIQLLNENNLAHQYILLRQEFLNAANNPGTNFQKAINGQISKITNVQIGLEGLSLSKDQRAIFNTFNKDNIIGENAINQLKTDITNNVGSYVATASTIELYSVRITQLYQTLNILQRNITPFLNSKLLEDNGEEDFLTLVFKNDASVDKLNLLQERAKQWKLILQWIKCVENSADFEIVSFNDGSCKITLKNTRDSIIIIGSLVTFALSNYNSYLDIQIKQYEISKIKAAQKEKKTTEPEEIKISQDVLNEISNDVATLFLEKYREKIDEKNYPICHSDISQASMYLLKFIDDGGEVEFTENGKSNPQIAQVANYFEKIKSNKLLDGKNIKLLPDLKEPTDDI